MRTSFVDGHDRSLLLRRLEEASQRMLTRTLCKLESTGLINRKEIKSKVTGVEYSLTQMGRTFLSPLNSMRRLAKRHNKEVTADVRLLETSQNRCATTVRILLALEP